MSRLTGNGARSLMEAYNAIYAPTISEDYLYEEFLTEEFILEAYQYVADFLVYEGHVPGYETAELFMSEMDEHWIDEILCDYGLYLGEGLFSNFANTVIGGAKKATAAVAGGVRKVAGAADRGAAAVKGTAQRVANTATGAAQRATGAVTRAATGAVNTVKGTAQRVANTATGAAQRAAGAVTRAATPVAQAVKGTAQRAVAAGQSALNKVGGAVKDTVQGTARAAKTAVTGAIGAAQGAARKIGQEIEISRKVGAGEPLTKPSPTGGTTPPVVNKTSPAPTGSKPGSKPAPVNPTGGKSTPVVAAKPAPTTGGGAKPAPTTGSGAKPAPAGTPATPANGAVANKKPSLAAQAAELRNMRKASQQRTQAMGGTPATALVQGFDMFDIVQGYLIDEGFADTEDAALAIMVNMSEEWRNQIIESSCGGSHSGKKSTKKKAKSGY